MIELLAPVGRKENVYFALHYGADAIYLGGQDFSLRANAQNFSLPEIKETVILAHELGKKVYVAVNIVFHDEDFLHLKEYLRSLDEIGVDAIIASDIAVVKLAQELACKFAVHLSTQASTLNSNAVKFWQKLGVKRVVLAREAQREDIIAIKKDTGIEVECFIHGAMCTSFSGKCILSNYMTNRDSNRGGCAQICRWNFTNPDGPDLTITPKDLNMVPFIADMIDIGVNSFKIEGRMRSIYYVATVILVYRRLIDQILNHTLTTDACTYYLNVLNRCANRDSAPQFYDKLPTEKEQYFITREEVTNKDFLGLVLDYDEKTKLVYLEQRNYFKVGDEVQFFGPNTETFSVKITEIYDEDKNKITVARHPQMKCYLKLDQRVQKYDMMRLKIFSLK